MATTPTNAINVSSAGLVKFDGTATFSAVTTTNHNVLIGAASNGITNVAPSATSGVALISQGAAADPAFGTVVVAGGGTGLTTLTAHSLYVGNGTSSPTALGSATNGQLPIGSTGADPVLATLTAGSGITITNGAGSITIAASGGAVETFTYISTQTASSSTNLDFTGIDSTYNRYRILISNLVPSTSGVTANLKLSTDGNSTFTNISSAWIGMLNTTSSSAAVVDASNTVANSSIALAKNGTSPIVGTIDIFMPAAATVQTMVEAFCTSTQTTSAPTSYTVKAQDETRQAINAFRIAASTGNFTSGTAILYGVS